MGILLRLQFFFQKERVLALKKKERALHVPMTVRAVIMLVVSGVFVISAKPVYDWIERKSIPYSDVPVYRPGMYESISRGYGGDVTVNAEFSEYGIEKVTVSAPEETPEVGGAAAVRLAAEIRKKQTCYVDAVAGATATSGAVLRSMEDCILQASMENNPLAKKIELARQAEKSDESPSVEALLKEVPDGDYTYLQEEGDENGYHDYIELTVKDHRLVSLTWDSINMETRTGKRELSESGQYTMREGGPLWSEQADELAGYIVSHQSEKGLLDESGYASDAVASVSIYAGGCLSAVKECLMRAADSE